MAENSFITRSLGTASEGIKDQYADGKAAKVWEIFIGDKKSRTQNYRNFLVSLLKQKGCKRILDVACGTGVDSIMLVEEGFKVVSIDASDKMLKYALKERWTRRKEAAFDNWVIEEANWVSLFDDIENLVGNGFDAVICLGNSFAHLLDNYGDQREQKRALRNFEKCIKPGGLLLIDHRNYDNIIETGSTTKQNIYYDGKHVKDIVTSVLYVKGNPALVTRDYLMYTSLDEEKDIEIERSESSLSQFTLSYYPHRLKVFQRLLQGTFGENSKYKIYGDFKPVESMDETEIPNYFIHVIDKYDTIY